MPASLVPVRCYDELLTQMQEAGTLGDEGGQALLDRPAITNLKKLDLHHHYLSDEMRKRFQSLPIEVDVSGQESEDDYGRYVAVGE